MAVDYTRLRAELKDAVIEKLEKKKAEEEKALERAQKALIELREDEKVRIAGEREAARIATLIAEDDRRVLEKRKKKIEEEEERLRIKNEANSKGTADATVTRTVVINGVSFTPLSLPDGIRYKYDYVELVRRLSMAPNPQKEIAAYRHCILTDLWFILYFVLKWPAANHPFIIDICREIEEGPQTQTLDVWFREAGKSTILTVARSIQEVLRNPNERVCIFSYARSPALSFLRSIKQILETSDILKACFPDIVWKDPEKESPKWSELEGLVVKRQGYHKESTFEAHGLLEGMPTGKHFSLLVFDDIVTADLVNTPDMMEKVKERFDLAINVGTSDGRHRVIGTFYHHDDPLVYIQNKKRISGGQLYCVRHKPATIDGTFAGKSVFLSEERLALLRSNRKQFSCQQLLDPTPTGEQLLNFQMIRKANKEDIPTNLYKFMVVDPSGSAGVHADGKTADAWACWVVGVRPELTDLGASDIYLLDGFIEVLSIDEAINKIVLMYCNSGRILKLGVEKMGAMTFEIHVANALRARGRYISVDSGSLQILNPSGRKKVMRIEQNLVWPLTNGKIYVSSGMPPATVSRLQQEMEKFPYWKDDGIDALAFVYDMIKDYRFGYHQPGTPEEYDGYLRSRKRDGNPGYHWMTV